MPGGRLRNWVTERIEVWLAALDPPSKGPSVTEEVERWRDGFWGRFAQIRASREPPRALLPEDERDWRPATWRHFRFVLIRHLQDEGAHSLDELVREPPAVLGLELNRRELKAAIDSARRREEIVELPRPAGSPPRTAEWVVTDRGRKATAHALPWLFEQGSRMRTWIPPSVAALSVFGIGVANAHNPSVVLVMLASIVVGLLVWLLISVRAVTSGAKAGRRVARDWSRWARAYPGWYRVAFRSFPWRAALLGILAFVAAVSLLGLGMENSAFVLSLVATVSFLRLIHWKERWDFVPL